MKTIFQFLGISEFDATELKAKTVKQNPHKLATLIENYDEVFSALQGTQHECFLEE